MQQPMDFESLRSVWPGVGLSPDAFKVEWGRLTDSADVGVALDANDLYLAVACRQRDEAALSAMRAMVNGLGTTFRDLGLGDDEVAALVSRTMALLVEGPAGGSPKLAHYSARAPLAGFVHALMTRLWLDDRRAPIEFDDAALIGVVADPELEQLRQRHRGQFSAAFRAAVGRLSARERNLLRQNYLDDLSLEDLSAFYRVHRLTVARWVFAARRALLEKVEQELTQRLGLGPSDVGRVMRIVASRVDLSASLVLGQESTR